MRSTKYTAHYTDTFSKFKEIRRTVSNIYNTCVPNKIKNRRNIDQMKQHDIVIIACIIWGVITGYTSQRATYRAVCTVLFPNGNFPSKSRFTRLSANLAYTIKIIRYFFIKKHIKGELVGIIDSFPSPLCKPVRNRRAKILNQLAKIGYNSTKNAYFYGLKIHIIVTKTGFPVTYSITDPSVHDVKVLETLSEEANLPNILGDKGYISHKIHEKLALKGITVLVPSRKNMDKLGKIDHRLLTRQRKAVETVFSSLERLGCQNFKSRSIQGLESKFESILLSYSILLSRAQQHFEGNLRYSLGY
ncbi:IS982 family transposase [Enterococcus faecium]|uniref:IS982 family transposase n=1 Tax=Enterococcus faecium TaxID=1352 RepID=UPI00190EDCAF|nr:IS982 family transposase [Enterococcus faecium]MBK4850314.1 transposase [Enterococcus faecium]